MVPANFLMDREGKIIAKNLRGVGIMGTFGNIFANFTYLYPCQYPQKWKIC